MLKKDIEKLCSQLGHEDPQVVISAIYQLGLLGPEAKEAVFELTMRFDSSDRTTQCYILWALGKIKDSSPDTINCLDGNVIEFDEGTLEYAVWTLTELDWDPKLAFTFLVSWNNIAKHSLKPWFAMASQKLLEKWNPSVDDLLVLPYAQNEDYAYFLIPFLLPQASSVIPKLMEKCQPQNTLEKRLAALFLLGKLHAHPQVIHSLFSPKEWDHFLQDPDREFRAHATQNLRQIALPSPSLFSSYLRQQMDSLENSFYSLVEKEGKAFYSNEQLEEFVENNLDQDLPRRELEFDPFQYDWRRVFSCSPEIPSSPEKEDEDEDEEEEGITAATDFMIGGEEPFPEPEISEALLDMEGFGSTTQTGAPPLASRDKNVFDSILEMEIDKKKEELLDEVLEVKGDIIDDMVEAFGKAAPAGEVFDRESEETFEYREEDKISFRRDEDSDEEDLSDVEADESAMLDGLFLAEDGESTYTEAAPSSAEPPPPAIKAPSPPKKAKPLPRPAPGAGAPPPPSAPAPAAGAPPSPPPPPMQLEEVKAGRGKLEPTTDELPLAKPIAVEKEREEPEMKKKRQKAKLGEVRKEKKVEGGARRISLARKKKIFEEVQEDKAPPKKEIVFPTEKQKAPEAKFEKYLSDSAGCPGPVERMVAQSKLIMKGIQYTMGLKFLIIANAFDILIDLVTSYIRGIYQTWKVGKMIQRRLARRDPKALLGGVLGDMAVCRMKLARIFSFAGFQSEKHNDSFLPEKEDPTNPAFALQIVIEVRGLMDDMKRDLSILTVREAREGAKQTVIGSLMSYIPNPLELIAGWKDVLLLAFWMKYPRRDIEKMYADLVLGYKDMLEELRHSSQWSEEQKAELADFFLELTPFEEHLPQVNERLAQKSSKRIEAYIQENRNHLQKILQTLCNPAQFIYCQKWTRWDLLCEMKRQKDIEKFSPQTTWEWERWLSQEVEKNLDKIGKHPDALEKENRWQEAQIFRKRYLCQRLLQKHFL